MSLSPFRYCAALDDVLSGHVSDAQQKHLFHRFLSLSTSSGKHQVKRVVLMTQQVYSTGLDLTPSWTVSLLLSDFRRLGDVSGPESETSAGVGSGVGCGAPDGTALLRTGTSETSSVLDQF